MNRFVIALSAVMVAGAAFAQKPVKPTAPKAQTVCPMMPTNKVDAKSKAVAYTGKNPKYKGKSVKYCCGGCEAPIKKDQDKYFAMVFGK
ncbi:hypothetical protein [Armatimonas sp.]|uniref:hypothetical protein n=1 Tax=Armatimonas sp. TaxID=1872638 RepID=UPI00286B3767|nr:hypothetical protein [Armatimonas sp.]